MFKQIIIILRKSKKIKYKYEKEKISIVNRIKLFLRIKKILILANLCMKNGIKFPSCKNENPEYITNYSYNFMANSYYKYFGFIYSNKDKKIKYLGFYIGETNIFTKGFKIKYSNTDKYNDFNKNDLLKDFICKFIPFERMFLAWIDSLEKDKEN